MHKIDVGDAELHVEISGIGPPLLLLAGLGGRGAFWRNQVEAFAQTHRLIVPDHRGCGSSTRGKCVTGIDHMASDILALIDALGLQSIDLVGHSTGGAIGQYIAIHHPNRIERLVLSCSWAGPDQYFSALFSNRKAILQDSGPEAYLAHGTFLAMPSSYLQPVMRSGEDIVADRLAEFPGMDVELSRIAAVMGHDQRDGLRKISAPTLCIGARDDQITPPGFTEELAARIPSAELHLLDRGGHFCAITAAREYNVRVGAFLNQ
ncbi:alpha/beta fold hydrolase [Parasphingopyxis algicola]|uniref:alpha/beta fold hydrolase n=1 Tax=Parasphingopyxis algicola TaxID=2026624 RepID=UPI0015A35C38|nr:alpha/beta fold hydrolase [Parasphingopyxis algicola]QLC26380.1 alpha/beta fold hydrolase [Parasphingopyxis algicola]